jgi:integrase
MPRLTQQLVDELIAEAPKHAERFIPDSTLQGFYLRTRTTGTASWVIKRRLKHRVLTRTLGPADLIPLVEARKKALAVLNDLSSGVDPLELKRREIRSLQLEASKSQAAQVTLGELLKLYLARHSKLTERSIQTMESSIHNHAKDWLDMPVRLITREMIENRLYDVLNAAAKRSKLRVTAGNVRGEGAQQSFARYIRALMRFAMDTEVEGEPIIETDPTRVLNTKGIIKSLNRRTSYLLPAQRQALLSEFSALTTLNANQADLVAFLLFTGCRLGEALRLRWEDIDAKNQVIALRNTKQGKDHHIPYGPTIAALIKRRSIAGTKGYFLSWDGGVSLVKSPYATLAKTGVFLGTVVTAHDLRRTFATVADEQGISLSDIGSALGHTINDGSAVTRGYVQRSIERLRYVFLAVDGALTDLIKKKD